jgi:hypothetical protein
MTAIAETLLESSRVATVENVIAIKVDLFGQRLLINAVGTVPTSGWSDVRLNPVFYIDPPADGIWDFDLIGDPPVGPVLTVSLPVSATGTFSCPDWVRGVRVRAENGVIEDDVGFAERTAAVSNAKSRIDPLQFAGTAIIEETIAVWDDSHQPIGFCSGWPPKLKMKKLRHNLVVTIEAPDGNQIRRCLNEAAAAGLVAAIAAVVLTGGGALAAAIGAYVSYLKGCIANASVRVDNRSHWIEWCT